MFSSIFETPLKINHVLYFIETAKLPIRYIISKRRLMYLREIMSRNNNELIKKVYSVQKLKPVRQD